MGDWDERNVRNLIIILRCFFMGSGLKINLFKSSLMRVGVADLEVVSLASFTDCAAAFVPFSYLGILMGGSMTRVRS